MLRIAVLVLLLANAGYYAWSHGLLRGLGMGPASESEPQRLQEQIAPQDLHVLAPAPKPASKPTNTPAPAAAGPTACLQAGTFDERQATALRTALAALPEGSWVLDAVPVNGRWMVYMGRFADEEAVAKKRAELRTLKIAYDRPGAALEPGLSLGRFSSEESAQRARAQLAEQGARTARVVLERAEANAFTLRLPAVDAALRPRLAALEPQLAGKPLRSCD